MDTVAHDCCANWPKPCSYHEGWQDASDQLPHQLVSSHEIAHRLGVKPQTVWQWVARGVLPAPWGSWGAPGKTWKLWEWTAVEQWAKATGRVR